MERRVVILAHGVSHDPDLGKLARGVLHYCHDVVALVDRERSPGASERVPVVATLGEALVHRPTVALLASAPIGGRATEEDRAAALEALQAGLHLEAGLHSFLGDDATLAEAARTGGVTIRDLRRPPADLDCSTGTALDHPATVVLTVGSDAAIGKMTAALEADAAARRRGVRSTFVPTGQTGIAIAGWGIAVDAVLADYIAGAAERLVLEGARRADLLWVEGQGGLLNPRYSGVTLGLYHGCAPHGLVLCHLVGRRHAEENPRWPLPSLRELIEIHERIATPGRLARVIGLSLNTSPLSAAEARRAVEQAAEETGLPVVDPVRGDAEPLVDAALALQGDPTP